MNRRHLRRVDRLEQVCRRLARHHRCTSCGAMATKGLLCDQHFGEAFNLGMVLH